MAKPQRPKFAGKVVLRPAEVVISGKVEITFKCCRRVLILWSYIGSRTHSPQIKMKLPLFLVRLAS